MNATNANASTDERFILLSRWVEEHTPSVVRDIQPASEDASFRRYFRVTTSRESLIAMDAPPPNEHLEPWLTLSSRLRSIGVAAPKVLAADEVRGFALISDLGNDTFFHALKAGADPDPLYGDAIHVLVSIQSRLGTEGLPPYDEAQLRREMALFEDWLLGRHLGITLAGEDAREWRQVTDWLVERALAQPVVFVHRDYHSRNLMPGPPGSPGVIDFQDAMAGPLCYDLVSLLKDCYVAWPAERVSMWCRQYLDLVRQTSLGDQLPDGERFQEDFDATGVQRHLKASGIFARLWHRDGKPGYLADVPRTLDHILACRDHGGRLGWLQSLIRERVLPGVQEKAS